MKTFKTNLAIQPTINPMGFTYDPGCFGPKVENRSLDAIRPSLMEPQCDGPDIVYSIAMDVGKNEHREYRELSVENQKCIYAQFEEAPGRFLFVPKPFLAVAVWEEFVP